MGYRRELMKWRWWRNADEMAAEFAAKRKPLGDEQFVSACRLPSNPLATRVALAVRRSVATYGMIGPEYIYAEDVYPDQLIELSGWDSIDFLSWVLELEKELEVAIPDHIFQDIDLAFSVQELAQRVYAYLE